LAKLNVEMRECRETWGEEFSREGLAVVHGHGTQNTAMEHDIYVEPLYIVEWHLQEARPC
jgi:hypothetical protein